MAVGKVSTVSAANPRRPGSFRLDLALGLIERDMGDDVAQATERMPVAHHRRFSVTTSRNSLDVPIELQTKLGSSGLTIPLLKLIYVPTGSIRDGIPQLAHREP